MISNGKFSFLMVAPPAIFESEIYGSWSTSDGYDLHEIVSLLAQLSENDQETLSLSFYRSSVKGLSSRAFLKISLSTDI